MTGRKKKGLGSIIAGVLSVFAGIVLAATTNTPEWVPVTLEVTGTLLNLLGFKIVYPDVD